MTENRLEKFQRIKTLSTLLDSKFEGPLGIKFGVDALLGLLPVVGDSVTSLMSFYIIFEAALLGCPLPILFRMVFNVLLENILDFVPFLGNIFDFFWKANQKNMQLLMAYETSPHKATRQSKLVLVFLVILLMGILALSIYGGYKVLLYLYDLTISAV